MRTIKQTEENTPLFVSSNTLGSREKPFRWCFTETKDLIISRTFKSDNEQLSFVELSKIDAFMSINDWVDLANNVAKLHQDTENEGLGWFMYNELGKSTTESQLSSQLAAIFVEGKIWDFNKKKRGMQFKRLSGDWVLKLNEFYKMKVHTIT